MLTYKNEWNDIEETNELAENVKTSITVIVPARNEAKTISILLHDILAQNYPKELFDVVVIDDHSEDETFEISLQFAKNNSQIKVYKLNELIPTFETTTAYKKRAIEAAVNLAKGDLIITTDADCRVQKNWLRSIATLYEKQHAKLIAAPVCFQNEQSYFQKFQSLDFCGMQAITGASLNMEIFNMANGANLAYEKKAFLEVNGYQDIDEKASGDDMLLVYKIAQKYPEHIRFLKDKNAIVYTHPTTTVSEFLQQRFRWTSKSTSYQDKRITWILGLVYLFVFSIWMNAFYFFGRLAYTSIFPDHTVYGLLGFLNSTLFFILFIFQVFCKSVVDYFFLKSASSFFNRLDLMKTFFISEVLHIWYIPFVGTFGNILNYKWKGRELK
ncbi:MAG: glycosyltransferase [Chitinophagales bacterium]